MSKSNSSGFWTDLFKKILRILLKNVGLDGRRNSRHQHVVPHDDGWAVKGEGNERVTAVYEKQSQAIERAKDIAYNYRSSVIIHGRDGSIRDVINMK